MDYKHGDIFELESECYDKKLTYFLVQLDVPFELWILISANGTHWMPPTKTAKEAFGGNIWEKKFKKHEVELKQ